MKFSFLFKIMNNHYFVLFPPLTDLQKRLVAKDKQNKHTSYVTSKYQKWEWHIIKVISLLNVCCKMQKQFINSFYKLNLIYSNSEYNSLVILCEKYIYSRFVLCVARCYLYLFISNKHSHFTSQPNESNWIKN